MKEVDMTGIKWDVIRRGTGSLVAARVKKCSDCEGGVNCPMDLFVSKIRNAPSKMNLFALAEEAGLQNVEAGIHLVAEGPVVSASCYESKTKIEVVNTDDNGIKKLNE